MMISYKAIGRRIKYYRKLAKMRQADLAEKLDVSISYISQLECGIAEVSLKRMPKPIPQANSRYWRCISLSL